MGKYLYQMCAAFDADISPDRVETFGVPLIFLYTILHRNYFTCLCCVNYRCVIAAISGVIFGTSHGVLCGICSLPLPPDDGLF
jgi:hypothetical protein